MVLTPELAAAYWATEYRVFAEDGVITLRPGTISADLEALQRRFGVRSSAFLTAYNPRSVPQEEHWNRQRQAELAARVALRWPFLRGEGVSPSGDWPPEESLLILGISFEEARELGCQYDQFSFLFGDEKGCVRLEACHPANQPVLDEARPPLLPQAVSEERRGLSLPSLPQR